MFRFSSSSSGFLAGTEDYMRQTGVCVKTHEFSIDHIPIFNNGAIILIRNPYYSVVSDYFRFFGGLKNISRNQLVESMESRNGKPVMDSEY